MKITTKTGDKGLTGLFGGRRVSKASVFVELVGELDELQSLIGWARCAVTLNFGSGRGDLPKASRAELIKALNRIQDDIYRIMAVVGFEMKCPKNFKTLGAHEVRFLEKYIEEKQNLVKNLDKFIRPGSSEIAARLHVVRAACRRVERKMIKCKDSGTGLSEVFLQYLNRLSDFLFIAAFEFEHKIKRQLKNTGHIVDLKA